MTGGGFCLNHIHVNSDLPSRKHLTDLKGASQDSELVQNEVGHPTVRNFGPDSSIQIVDVSWIQGDFSRCFHQNHVWIRQPRRLRTTREGLAWEGDPNEITVVWRWWEKLDQLRLQQHHSKPFNHTQPFLNSNRSRSAVFETCACELTMLSTLWARLHSYPIYAIIKYLPKSWLGFIFPPLLVLKTSVFQTVCFNFLIFPHHPLLENLPQRTGTERDQTCG